MIYTDHLYDLLDNGEVDSALIKRLIAVANAAELYIYFNDRDLLEYEVKELNRWIADYVG